MSLTIPQRVDKGINVLETYLPGGEWALKLNPKKLVMSNPDRCVLGQLAPYIYPHHSREDSGLSPYFGATGWIADDHAVDPVHDDGDWTADYGFQSALHEWRGDEFEFNQIYTDLIGGQVIVMEEYGMLWAEWTKRINEIREASHG